MKRRLVTDISYDKLFAFLKPHIRYENQTKDDQLRLLSVEVNEKLRTLTFYTEVVNKNADSS